MEEQLEPYFPNVLWEDITTPSPSVQKALDCVNTWSDADWNIVEQELGCTHLEKGKPVSWDWLDSMIETLEVLSDGELMDAFRRGIQDMAEGRVYLWEDVKRELGLE